MDQQHLLSGVEDKEEEKSQLGAWPEQLPPRGGRREQELGQVTLCPGNPVKTRLWAAGRDQRWTRPEVDATRGGSNQRCQGRGEQGAVVTFSQSVPVASSRGILVQRGRRRDRSELERGWGLTLPRRCGTTAL